jgi:ubiquinone/menaquinone biosynthesis C-methylase UbiE
MPKDPSEISSADAVREMYDSTAESYASMMDTEIDDPMYADILQRLRSRLENIPGMIIDAPCGSGHMLSMYHATYDKERRLFGVDLSPQMVAITQRRLGAAVETAVCDIRQLEMLADNSAAAVISHFGFHHLDLSGVSDACKEWHRVLIDGGQLVLAAWEGSGAIDYGEHADLVAVRHKAVDLQKILADIGFDELKCDVEFDEEMAMDAVYIEACKKA